MESNDTAWNMSDIERFITLNNDTHNVFILKNPNGESEREREKTTITQNENEIKHTPFTYRNETNITIDERKPKINPDWKLFSFE